MSRHPDTMTATGVPLWRLMVHGSSVTGATKRRIPNAKRRAEILERQKNACLYCDFTFGSQVMRGSRPRTVQLAWDHFVPYAYTQNSHYSEFVAACRACNEIKNCQMFSSVQEARDYIQARRAVKGYPACLVAVERPLTVAQPSDDGSTAQNGAQR